MTVLVPLSSLSFDQTSLSVFKGKTASLTLIKNPSDATLKGSVQWNSSNTSVATVSNDGVVTAVKKGNATITATVDGCTAECSVSVLDAVTGITLDRAGATINRGNTLKLNYSVQPTGATLQGQVTWESDDSSVATVDNTGTVTAIAEGAAKITVSLEGFSAHCYISVVVPVSYISLNKNTLRLNKGESETLMATIDPSDATDKTVTWSSSNTNVATVNKGKVQAVGAGTAVITAKAGDCTATCAVTVLVPVTSVSLSTTSILLNKGESTRVSVTVTPSDATYYGITYSITDNSIASVRVESNKSIVIGAKNGGTAILTISAGEKSTECPITVVVPVSSISLNTNSVTIKQNQSVLLVASVGPDDATDKTVTWSSSNTAIATVDSGGKVKAISEGSATITAKAGEITATCNVIVSNTSSGGHEGTGTETWD